MIQPRMVMTPWYEEPIPFNMAAEIGTKKVITEHSTIGLVITTDGSISDIPREEYEEAEERVINELKEINKPFIVIYNCVEPDAEASQNAAAALSAKYGVPVLPINCLEAEKVKFGRYCHKSYMNFLCGKSASRCPNGFPAWKRIIGFVPPFIAPFSRPPENSSASGS